MKTVAEVLTFENFQAWINDQPPAEEFNYIDSRSCAVAKFLTAQGLRPVGVGPHSVMQPEYVEIPLKIRKAMNVHMRSFMQNGWYTYRELSEALEKASTA